MINDIEKTLNQEFCCYGYRNMTGELREMGWIINHKKVYRLMKQSRLLYGGRIRPEPLSGILSVLEALRLNVRFNICPWISSTCMFMEPAETHCC
ncbi:MAG: transposase [Chitinophagaceae bacterium]|nr:transposase [Chitinophagaceae bacterium]